MLGVTSVLISITLTGDGEIHTSRSTKQQLAELSTAIETFLEESDVPRQTSSAIVSAPLKVSWDIITSD